MFEIVSGNRHQPVSHSRVILHFVDVDGSVLVFRYDFFYICALISALLFTFPLLLSELLQFPLLILSKQRQVQLRQVTIGLCKTLTERCFDTTLRHANPL